MKNFLLFTFLAFANLYLSQSNQRVSVSGTKYSMIPPEGFEKSQSFSGFQHTESGSSIMINELPASYEDLVKEFTSEALKSKGMNLLDKTIIDFNGSKANVFKITQVANGKIYLKQLLVFGDQTKTVLVNGIYPEINKNLEESIKKSILSTIYNSEQNVDPANVVSFSVDIADSGFKFIKYMSGSLLYSIDGKIPTDKPTIIVGNSISKISVKDFKKFAEDRFRSLPGAKDAVFKNVNKITIDNLNGYEIIAEVSEKEDQPQMIYQTILFNEDSGYFIIVGQTKENFEKYKSLFQKISKTFKRK
ncbi:hypothetical protein NZ698_01725 [Chryseobacterium sp. PBS4-4]|uniref:DUF1795 domain-containing protein n=1 Tax=Chryseobacterium edaphi TaxID=2976532 RepID=A0ABT2W3U6_9FLAO|nr:hypothetical protein [Chryseobacterium edaphi]MCU7615902.1 hypothetical protein [Chryseobacterium edaphi]